MLYSGAKGTGNRMRRLLAIFILASIGGQATADACRVPDGTPIQWVADICLFKNETDDVTLESVQACIANETALQTDCDMNEKYKAEYCRLLIESQVRAGTIDDCVDDRSVHGQTVAVEPGDENAGRAEIDGARAEL